MMLVESRSLHLASWPSRLAAYVIDYILYMVGIAIAMVGVFILLIGLFEDDVVHDSGSIPDLADGADMTMVTIGALVLIMGLALLIGYVVWWFLALRRGQTPGK